ncbi:MAG: F0F1 ATP synthase subunit gamma [Pseudomonadota bacterium]|nr:F0F1 ATP synthase subunit gamma [Pseudomonadota bacterium]
MSNRLGRAESRIHTLADLRAVTAAMRGIAAARAREAEARLTGVDRHAAIVAASIADALAVDSGGPPEFLAADAAGPPMAIVVLSQGGFVGTLNERVLATADAELTRSARILLLGGHGVRIAAERGLACDWVYSMAANAALVPALAREVARQVLGEAARSPPSRLVVIHAESRAGGQLDVATRLLLPFDFSRFGRASAATLPRLQIPLEQLLAALVAQFLHTRIHAALLLGLLAENTARREAVSAMHGNLDHKLESAHAEYRSLRQEEITAEILELSGTRHPLRAML